MSALFSRQRKPEPERAPAPVPSITAESRPQKAVREQRWVLRHHHTEKAARLEEGGTYVFVVALRATKPEVRKVIEARYGVKVRRVRMIRIPALKSARGGRITRRKQAVKKAIVTLEKGKKIEEKAEAKS